MDRQYLNTSNITGLAECRETEENQKNTISFAAKKALIFTQSNYSLTRQINCKGCKSLKDLEPTDFCKEKAAYIASGFGIVDTDIVFIENWTLEEINEIVKQITH